MHRPIRIADFHIIKKSNTIDKIPKGVQLIQAPKIWEQTRGENITIAILDTGCDINHSDLKDRIIGGQNFTDDDQWARNNFQDYQGHGTHVAGIIGASQDTNGIVGVAPMVNLLIVKVLNRDGYGEYDWLIRGINYAIDRDVDIISLSLGGPFPHNGLFKVIKKAVLDHHIPVVCAAGNDGDGDHRTDEVDFPASYQEVISVGAVNFEKNTSIFSNSNNKIDLVAPGEGINSTYLHGGYATLSGTSMAAPHVSGSLALLKNITKKQFNRTLSEPELYAQLIKRTISLGYPATLEGNGLLYLNLLDQLTDSFNQFKNESVSQLII
ncbi:major intracellular serine protease [Natronobacillus azotifigens]|uniref:S8 family peptidase n=1 Tax=Natronobacillus azotifigens TaxID=472978 RepID=A0A9J6R7S4_9BACI|nr:S8 family peptidase [Natronobacillus azotifigens]MCZ0701688.1 S8 family peptidase [Natronobacillus azotifigens]